MTCVCGQKFCYLCGVKLTEEDHIPHFSGFDGAQGPFGATCANRQKALAEHQRVPGAPPPPQLRSVSDRGPMGEYSTTLQVEWDAFRAEPPVVEYAVELCEDGQWKRVGTTYETQLDLLHVDVVPGREYLAALCAANMNGWGPLGEPSQPICVDRRGTRALLLRELSGEVWPGVAQRRRPRNLRPLRHA